ncbi:hypothetical protein IFM89_008718 [Coptis chinensis]|uniref:Uncharacterized protein n=1 Tax=Coptis chinensis TaxID=261450 RepID=A0A835GVI2_9MAGN|nr:hypothetical protein IFM89_008718 [Coptis chinensis]
MTNNNLPRRIRKIDYVGRESVILSWRDRPKDYKGPNGEGPDIYLKREDLNHTGAHKINNVVAQALLAKRFDLSALSIWGSGYGEAVNLMFLECNFSKTEVRAVHSGPATLKDATSKAIRDWATEKWGGKPDVLVACVGGGSNVMGLFHEFVDDSDVRLIRVEAAGHGVDSGRHAPGISASPSEETMQYFNVMILGPTQSPYEALPIDDLIEKADGFAGVFPEHKYEIVKRLQARKHICGMTGDGVNDAPALKKADIGIAIADSTDAARSASDIVPTNPPKCHHRCCIDQESNLRRMKNYTVIFILFMV